MEETLAEISNPDWFNNLGYEFVGDNQMNLAIQVFRHNVKVHPDYANGFDSIGETDRATGQIQLPIEAYEQALTGRSRSESAMHECRSPHPM